MNGWRERPVMIVNSSKNKIEISFPGTIVYDGPVSIFGSWRVISPWFAN